MAGNKRTTIQKLTVLQTRLMLVGIVLAVACGVCTVLLSYEKEPEPELVLPTVPFMSGAWTEQPEAKETQPEPSKAEKQALPDETTAPVLQDAADAMEKKAGDATGDTTENTAGDAAKTGPVSTDAEDKEAEPEPAVLEAPKKIPKPEDAEIADSVPNPDVAEITQSAPNSQEPENVGPVPTPKATETTEPAPETEASEDTEHSSEPVAANAPSDPTAAGNTEAATDETTATEATTATEPAPEAPPSQVRPSVPVFPPMTAPVEEPQQELKAEEKQLHIWFFAAVLLDVLLGIDLVMLVLTHKRLKKERAKQATIKPVWHPEQPKIGKVHGIGARSYQQDSLGHTSVLGGSGILAMVADGMGGLAGGDQVSQQIIMSGLNYGAAMTSCQETNPLVDMVRSINGNINRMLGPDLIYKCGSTFIAVLNIKNRFHWISIGDSRIYLYRAGFVNQLNTDHDLMQLWMPEILAGSRSYAAAAQNPEGRKLTSFIGMGELKYVDYSRQALRLRPGDRLVLLTDGIYGAVSPETLAAILRENTDVSDAAQALERGVQAAGLPYQDNYTALILGY